MLSLALPVALGELGWMAMGVVDVIMVGRLSAEAIGGVSVGRALFLGIGIFGIGVLLGLDTLVSQAYGAGDVKDCHVSLVQGVYMSLLITVPVTVAVFGGVRLLPRWGITPDVAPLAAEYARAAVWSALPLYIVAAFRRYLQSMNQVRPVMIALISANLVNVLANRLLIFGALGVPALGVAGAGWATVIASLYMMVFLLFSILLFDRAHNLKLRQASLRPNFARLRRLWALGLPAAAHVTVELGAFALGTAFAGRLAAAQLAAHQIALTAASVTFMVPLGISSAAAVRVGQAIGRGDPPGAVRAGWTAHWIGVAFMSLAATVFLLFPEPLIRVFSSDPEVIGIGVTLLAVAAAFQLFDGSQVVTTGALRGVGDTRSPFVVNVIGHWLIGLPLGYYLTFSRGMGAIGLWVGFCVGLIFVGVVLLRVWSRRIRRGLVPALRSGTLSR
jgi:MATE family multidrug resistance protein